MFKNIFARIWAFWGLLTFAFTFLLAFPFAMIAYAMEEKKGQIYFTKVSRVWMSTWLFLIGCTVHISGRSNFIKGRNYIVLFNHNALLDVPLSSPFVPGSNKTIAKASFSKVPVFGLYYSLGSVLVDRKDEKSRAKSFDKMLDVLSKGMHMSIYPEGTRNRSSEPLKSFYDGAFRLAKSSGKEIIPCIIKGTKEAMPASKTFYLLPAKLSLQFLPAISPVDLSVQELKDKVYNIMLKAYTSNYKS